MFLIPFWNAPFLPAFSQPQGAQPLFDPFSTRSLDKNRPAMRHAWRQSGHSYSTAQLAPHTDSTLLCEARRVAQCCRHSIPFLRLSCRIGTDLWMIRFINCGKSVLLEVFQLFFRMSSCRSINSEWSAEQWMATLCHLPFALPLKLLRLWAKIFILCKPFRMDWRMMITVLISLGNTPFPFFFSSRFLHKKPRIERPFCVLLY